MLRQAQQSVPECSIPVSNHVPNRHPSLSICPAVSRQGDDSTYGAKPPQAPAAFSPFQLCLRQSHGPAGALMRTSLRLNALTSGLAPKRSACRLPCRSVGKSHRFRPPFHSLLPFVCAGRRFRPRMSAGGPAVILGRTRRALESLPAGRTGDNCVRTSRFLSYHNNYRRKIYSNLLPGVEGCGYFCRKKLYPSTKSRRL